LRLRNPGAEPNKTMKKLLIIFFLLFSTIVYAGTVEMPQYDVNGSVTNVNLNARFTALTNAINGGLNNNNAATSTGFWFIEVLGTLPSAGNQGRVVFVTTTNTLYFDTGTSWVTVATLPSNQTFAGNNTFTGNNTFQGADSFANIDINDGTADSVDIGAASQGTAKLVSLELNYAHKGDLLYDDGTGKFARLRPNENNYVLTSQGTTNSPQYKPLQTGILVYTSTGNNNVPIPSGITKVYLSMVGGGGGGGSGKVDVNGGGGGGAGMSIVNYPYTVTGGTTYVCSVGTGGGGATGFDGAGDNGTDTVFNSAVTAALGVGGAGGTSGAGGAGGGVTLSASGQVAGGFGVKGGDGGNKNVGTGGGGGGTLFGAGIIGATNGNHGSDAVDGTGAGGAGGGGSGGTGGDGGDGICIVMY
jgi:hypothetical protein